MLWIGELPNACCWATGSEGMVKQSHVMAAAPPVVTSISFI